MLIIFDVDGTLIGGETHDWACFDRALHQVLGFVHLPGFFDSLENVTAPSIVEAAALSCGIRPTAALYTQVQEAYLGNLREVGGIDPNLFDAREGAYQLLNELASAPGIDVAIATGDWFPTISYKLECAGLDLSRFSIATASDASRRAEIIKIAAGRSGLSLDQAIYVGDGTWDLRACNELGIPFVGTGTRIERLRKAGANHLCEDFAPDVFLEIARNAALRSLCSVRFRF